MRFQTLAAATLTALAVPGISLAEFNYTSAEFNFVDIDVDIGPFSVDGDGFSIGGTYPVADNFYVGASYESYDFDAGVDGDWLEIGGGYFRMLDDDLDFVATLSLVDVEVSSGFGSADDDGIAIGGGIRAQLSDTIEVDALLKYVDMDKGDNDTGIELRGRYYISDEFAVQLKLSTVNDFDTLSIGVRGEF